MTSERHQLIEEYLRRLDNASVFLPADRRAELRQEIVEHIDAGLEEAEGAYVAAVRAVLERLGPPADIVAVELGPSRSSGSLPIVRPPARPAAPPERAAIEVVTGEHGPLVAVAPEAQASTERGRRRRRTGLLVVGGVGLILAAGVAVMANGSSADMPEEPPPVSEESSSYPGPIDDEPSSAELTETPTPESRDSETPDS